MKHQVHRRGQSVDCVAGLYPRLTSCLTSQSRGEVGKPTSCSLRLIAYFPDYGFRDDSWAFPIEAVCTQRPWSRFRNDPPLLSIASEVNTLPGALRGPHV